MTTIEERMKNPNLNVKEWWKRIPNAREYGCTKNETIYSYTICPSCESDTKNGVCTVCETTLEE